MRRTVRKELKTDKFAQEVGNTWEFLAEHRAETVRYGGIAVAVLIVAGGIYFYMRHQAGVREDLLMQTQKIEDATVGATPQPLKLNFPTAEAKEQARIKAYTDLATKYRGSMEGAVAGIYLAAAQSDKGNFQAAEKLYQDVVDSAPSDYAALARMSLAEVYEAEGKNADAEKLLRYVMDHPSALVSKDQATLGLGELLVKTNPAEARKLLEPLRNARTAISRAAIDELGKLPQAN